MYELSLHLTKEQFEDFDKIFGETMFMLIDLADKYNIDRNDLIRFFGEAWNYGEYIRRRDVKTPKSEWISVKDRLPETTPKEITFGEQDIASGAITKIEKRTAQVSEMVSVLCTRCLNGEIETLEDVDCLIDGQWENNLNVTHWKPLEEGSYDQ